MTKIADCIKIADAEFDDQDNPKYRYWLERTWCQDKPKVCFVLYNPSHADKHFDDATSRHCIEYARNWNDHANDNSAPPQGFGGIVIVNLYPAIDSDQAKVHAAEQIPNQINDKFILKGLKSCQTIVVGWGGKGLMSDVNRFFYEFREEDQTLRCFYENEDGSPRHPSRMPKDPSFPGWPSPDRKRRHPKEHGRRAK